MMQKRSFQKTHGMQPSITKCMGRVKIARKAVDLQTDPKIKSLVTSMRQEREIEIVGWGWDGVGGGWGGVGYVS